MGDNNVNGKNFFGNLLSTVNQVSSTVAQTSEQLLNSFNKTSEMPGLLGELQKIANNLNEITQLSNNQLSEEVQAFVSWLRQKDKGPVEVETISAEKNPTGQPLTLVRLKETGFMAQNYLFSFAPQAAKPLTEYLLKTASENIKYSGIALLAGQWPPNRFELEKELCVIVQQDRVRLGKDSAAADYVVDWVAEYSKTSKFEKRELIDSKGSELAQQQTRRTDLLFSGRHDALTSIASKVLATGAGKAGQPGAEAAWIFSVTGSGGVGKSYLLQQIESLYGPRLLCGLVDHESLSQIELEAQGEASLVKLISTLAYKLKSNGLSLSRFENAHKDYLVMQSRKVASKTEDSSAVNATKSFTKALGGTDAKNIAKEISKHAKGFSFLKHLPGVINIGGTIAEMGFYVYDRISQEEQLKNDAVVSDRALVELTNALVQDLAKFVEEERKKYYLWRRPMLAFDTYELVGPLADTWLRTVLLKNPIFQSLDPLVIVAGRLELAKLSTRWSAYQSATKVIRLEPFDAETSQTYLAKLGTTDPQTIAEWQELSGGLPLFLQLLVSTGSEEEAIRQLKDRVLEEVKPEWQTFFIEMAVPEGFTLDTVKRLLTLNRKTEDDELAQQIYQYLQQASFVEGRSVRLQYLPVVRRVLLRYGEMTSPEKLEKVKEALSR